MTPEQKKLLRYFSELQSGDRETLLAFAEFLAGRGGVKAEQPPAEPKIIPRPEHESVVAAIRRLSASYAMLDKAKVLNDASALMAQHVLHGREAVSVIDELEVLFQRHYRRMLEQREQAR